MSPTRLVDFLRKEAAGCFELSRIQKTKTDATAYLSKRDAYDAAADFIEVHMRPEDRNKKFRKKAAYE